MFSLKTPEGYSAAVLHTHTNYTDGMVSTQELVLAASKAGIRVLAITDHDTIEPALQAQKIGRKLKVEVIVGEEIQTSLPRGLHIVGLFLKKPIAHSKPVIWTIREIRRQGGLAIIAHPMVRIGGLFKAPIGAFQIGDIKKVIHSGGVDGVEIRHQFLNQRDQLDLDKFYFNNHKMFGAQLGSSDSHFGQKDMFSYLTLFPGKSAQDLYLAIKNRTTKVAHGPKPVISYKEKIWQTKKSFVDLGLRRYLPMAKRWSNLNFTRAGDYL